MLSNSSRTGGNEARLMMDRRTAIGISALGVAAFSSTPARACRELREDLRTPAKLQIEDIATQIQTEAATGAIVADDDTRSVIDHFIRTTRERRNELESTTVEIIASQVYESGSVQVFLINFLLEGSDKILIGCEDNLENNHAIISFRAGTIVDFHPMIAFNKEKRVALFSNALLSSNNARSAR